MEVYTPIHRNREEVLVVSSDDSEEEDFKDADEEVSSDEDFEDAEEVNVSATSSEDEEVGDPEVILQDLIGLKVDQERDVDDDGLSNMPRESLRGSASPEPGIEVVTNFQESEGDNLSDAETVVVTVDDLLTAKLENDKAKKIEKEEDDEEKEEEEDRVPSKVDHHFIPDEELTVQVKVAYEEEGASGGGNGKAPEPGKIKTEDDKLVSRDFKHLLIGKDPKVEVGQYSCYCGKDFNSRTTFKKHLNDVNQVFLEHRGQHCRICGMEFGLKDEETRKLEGCFGCRFMWDIPEGGSRMRDKNEFKDVKGAQRRKTRKPAKKND